ncbi:TRAP transporter small permease [Chelativorans sp. Marseille-P2723]|uniref:TRAP transporter small permease n=1 Tax=Chelativorans sp. Marseille-P2723 TaxID=2709133 RepID=UPI001570DB0A|nr:TRAP transporter small permease [Chelativorans sp. Marseille-P2723]
MSALLVIMVAVNANVVSRFFNLPLVDLSELALSAMLPLTFIGAALCSNIREHIRLDLVDAIPNPKYRLALEIIADAAFVTFSVFFIWASYGLMEFSYTFNERLITTGIPVWITVAFMVGGGVLMLVHSVFSIVRTAARFRTH